MAEKPLGRKNYGSIPHLPNSRMGPADKSCHEGQARIATQEARDKHDLVIVLEKLDGSNVGVALHEGEVIALGRAGYPAQTSPYEQHQLFAEWVRKQEQRFRDVLRPGERLVGEWLAQAHGTRYELEHEPFVAFDIMEGSDRMPWEDVEFRLAYGSFVKPYLIHRGDPISVADAFEALGEYGHHGALDPVEGLVYRVERNKLVDRHSGDRKWVVDFLVKWVRPDKVDGHYLPNVSGEDAVWNWWNWRPGD